MAEYVRIVTVLQRLLDAGLSASTAERHLRYGRVWVNGKPVTDRYAPVGRADRVEIRQPPGRPVIVRASWVEG